MLNLIVYLKSRNTIADLLYRLHATSTMEYYEDMLIKKEIAARFTSDQIIDMYDLLGSRRAKLKLIEM